MNSPALFLKIPQSHWCLPLAVRCILPFKRTGLKTQCAPGSQDKSLRRSLNLCKYFFLFTLGQGGGVNHSTFLLHSIWQMEINMVE